MTCAALFGTVEKGVAETDRIVAAFYPPLMINASYDKPGSAIEIIREAARRAGRDVTIEFLPFQRAMHLVKQGEAIMPSLFRNEAREPHFTWVTQIDSMRLQFLTLDQPLNSLVQARELSMIGVEAGAATDVFLTKQGFDNIVRLPGPEASAQMLQVRRIGAWLLPADLAQDVWDRLDFPEELHTGASIHEYAIYVVGGLDLSPEMARDYRLALRSMERDGSLTAILLKYR
ncbi:transporter substrate-binding domain-containing protein [uncultured Tateyamaria sp.]|uniref:substrate-binding periplasmic protein n=1 Tax=uncultured Tateyamaria sp. TaxID=455651 RepID=UPI00261F30DC|nr:transporter substrate-binding domain-containing protein [uncultured Tateyamaria sp.]